MDNKRVMFFLCALIVIFVIPSVIFAVSFDCGKAKTVVEKLICGDDELSKLDESLNEVYLRALNRSDIKEQAIESQRQWLKYERDVCQNAECIKKAYETRIKELSLALNSLPLSSSQPPRELATNSEVILISGYEPANKEMTRGVKVEIDRPGSRVLLVLTSHEKVDWQVSATPSTTISGILMWGDKTSTVTTSVPTREFLLNLPFPLQTECVRFKQLLTTLNTLFGIEKVDAFRGSYVIPNLVRISSLEPFRPELTVNGPPPQRPDKNFTFDLLTTSFKKSVWSLTGPLRGQDESIISDKRIAISKSGKVIYRLRGDDLEISDQLGDNRVVATLPINFPKFSSAEAIAYDSKRDIVSVVTSGGEGFLYRFDARRKQWIDCRSLNYIDIYSLSYDRSKNRYIAWTRRGTLIFISGDGNALFTRNVVAKLVGFGRLYDGDSYVTVPRLTIVPHKNDVVLLYILNDSVKNIWYYNIKTDTAVFTYSKELMSK